VAKALHVYIKDRGAADTDPISVEHVFYGRTEAEVDKKRAAHLAGCSNFTAAESEGRVEDFLEKISADQVPTWAMLGEDDDGADDPDEDEGDEPEDEGGDVIDVSGGPAGGRR
jgi:hypothetical protein